MITGDTFLTYTSTRQEGTKAAWGVYTGPDMTLNTELYTNHRTASR